MGIGAWIILLVISAVLATSAQFILFARDRGPGDHDWVYIGAGALIGGFTGHAWYPGPGPMIDGLNLLPAFAGSLVGAVLIEAVYRLVLRPRQPNA